MNKKGILEGILFVVGDDGLTLKQIEDISGKCSKEKFYVKHKFSLLKSFSSA